MIPYSFSEIENKHGQPIYMFSKQAGNTELEKCLNFAKAMNNKVQRFDTKTKQGDITCIVGSNMMDVFNSSGEKVEEVEIDFEPTSILDLEEDLFDIEI